MVYRKIGIRPIIDGRMGGIRESLESKTVAMAMAAKHLIEENVFYADGTPAQVVIAASTIGGGAEAAACADQFSAVNVAATLSVTPCWCYGSETMDIDPRTLKAVWGFNGTERPGAVYLAAAMAAHNQLGSPAFAIYGEDVQDLEDNEIPVDVAGKILSFARCALAVAQMDNRAYVGIGGVSMGIMGSAVDPLFLSKYLGMRTEWVDMSEVQRRLTLGIYDPEEYAIAMQWTREHCREGEDRNPEHLRHSAAQKANDWQISVKMALIFRDILVGNEHLASLGWTEEARGRNGIAGGFQGQRMWSDWLPNGDFAEAILNTTFDWKGARQPLVFATENDCLNGITMLMQNLLTQRAAVFADVRTYWSPVATERVSGQRLSGMAEQGVIHLINSGAAALDASGCSVDAEGAALMKRWWEMTAQDITACLAATSWCPANLDYFRGGGYSSHFSTAAEMPVTLARINLVNGLGPVLQIAEGYTVVLPEEVHRIQDQRTDPAWPTTWFVPRLTGSDAFQSVYTVMANWGANHGSFVYGHIGSDLITLASMLRIPVSLHNIADNRIFRPHMWQALGTRDSEGADYRACALLGPRNG
ncbi:MAG: L-fucose isomerase [Symbiobacteriaceae bacterium]|nr:L-fucose isomerase [Symbiobacteriaceae bacterium]